MCGITGFTGPPDTRLLKKMAATLIHRGPDDQADYQDEYCSMAIRRLSIIDLTPGIYPMRDESDEIVCVFNGEIYNFKDIRKSLKKLGHQFRTNCDAEVVVHGYEEWGSKVLDKLNGMFAICIWDKKRKRLFLARDRMGQKPLYWTKVDSQLIFASELKAILAHPDVQRQLDLDSLNKYLLYEYVPSPATIFKNIFKIKAGHFLVFEKGKVGIKRYWDAFQVQSSKFKVQSFSSKFKIKEEDYIRELDRRLNQAVKLRLIADVPLGVFLSGGIDSSTIAYYMTQHASGKVKSFSIGFKETSFDESSYARLVADALGTEHHEKLLDLHTACELIPEIYKQLAEPLADAALIPNYLLCQYTRKKVKVALGGDGGDELLMGYPTFQAHKLSLTYQKLPKTIKTYLIEKIVNLLPVSHTNFSLDFVAKKFISGFDYPAEIRNQIWLGNDPATFADKLLLPEIRKKLTIDVFEDIKRLVITPRRWPKGLLRGESGEDLWNSLIYLYLKTYLQDDILTVKDRASMYCSLEVRSPFLDYQVVDFVNSIPPSLKLRGWTTKYILKKLMKGRLPDKIIKRDKKGFGIPLSLWLTKELKELMLELLSKKRIEKDGLFSYPFVKKLIDEHLNKRRDNRKQLWTLMCFQMWKERWLRYED